jgi:putative inorganic carbon (hco3(-)) transporter
VSAPRSGRLAGATIVALAAAPLAFPLQMPVIAGSAVAAVIGYCLWDAFRNGLPSWPRTFSVSVGILVVMIVVGALRSPFPDVTAPKFCSLVLGLAVMWVLDRGIASRRDLMLAVGGYIIVGVMLVVVGSLGTTWQWKFAGLYAVAHMLPRGIENLPGTDGGVSANALGAAVLLVLPAGAMAMWSATRPGSTAALRRLGFDALAAGVIRAGCVLAILAISTILLLTQSRTAWLSLAVTVAGLAAVRSRMARRLLVTITALGVVVVSLIGPQRLLGDVERLVRRASAAGPHFAFNVGERTVIWSYALEQLRQSPVIGIGLGAFRRTVRSRSIPSASSGADIAHAHNVFIQTALDIGLVGLAAYTAILLLSLRMAWSSYRCGDVALRHLALGFGGNVLAVHLFGLVDAVALGAKIGVLLWASIGLIVAMHRLADLGPPARTL